MPRALFGRHLAHVGSAILLGYAALMLATAAHSQAPGQLESSPSTSAAPAPPAAPEAQKPSIVAAETPPSAPSTSSASPESASTAREGEEAQRPLDAAEPDDREATRRCVADHTRAQEERINGHLLEAGELFERCAAAACPDMVRADCEEWGSEVQAELPRVRLELPPGTVFGEVQVFVDDQSITPTFDTPMVFDPGTITLRVEGPGGRVFKAELTLVAGEPTRLVRVKFSEPAFSAPPIEARPLPPAPPRQVQIPTLSYVFGGVALGSFAVATGFAAAGLSDHSAAERRCAPLCSAQVAGEVYDELLVADVALSVGVASAATAVILYLIEVRDGGDGPPNVALAFGPRGGAVTVGGGF